MNYLLIIGRAWSKASDLQKYAIIGIVLLSSLVIVGLAIWFIPPLHARAAEGYHAGKKYVGLEKASPHPQETKEPSEKELVKIGERLSTIEAQFEVQQSLVSNQEKYVAELQVQLKEALTEAAKTNDILLKQKEEWLAQLRKVAQTSVRASATGSSVSLLPSGSSSSSSIQSAAGNQTVHLNSATVEQFISLPNIGQTYAQRIVAYRTEHGAFTTLEDLKNVSGIGDATFNKIKNLIAL